MSGHGGAPGAYERPHSRGRKLSSNSSLPAVGFCLWGIVVPWPGYSHCCVSHIVFWFPKWSCEDWAFWVLKHLMQEAPVKGSSNTWCWMERAGTTGFTGFPWCPCEHLQTDMLFYYWSPFLIINFHQRGREGSSGLSGTGPVVKSLFNNGVQLTVNQLTKPGLSPVRQLWKLSESSEEVMQRLLLLRWSLTMFLDLPPPEKHVNCICRLRCGGVYPQVYQATSVCLR